MTRNTLCTLAIAVGLLAAGAAQAGPPIKTTPKPTHPSKPSGPHHGHHHATNHHHHGHHHHGHHHHHGGHVHTQPYPYWGWNKPSFPVYKPTFPVYGSYPWWWAAKPAYGFPGYGYPAYGTPYWAYKSGHPSGGFKSPWGW